MDPKTLFAKSLAQASACIQHVDSDQLTNPTPCSEWDLRALLNHMVYELLWVPELIKGKTVAEVGKKYDRDVLTSDFHQAWKHAADAALVAVHQADLEAIAHLSYADVPMSAYINEIAGDILIHTWDVDQAIQCSLMFDPEVVEVVYSHILPRKEEFANSGLFAKPIAVSDDADTQTKLLALVGRCAPNRTT